ncbi:hypothetical protein llap_3608 [Limosa lapponica baueri]|uniref:Uncharacterized protein n=1 Tax=Limosa lapponica baueri TaxID=1758121 RepID=A0A2I0UJ79_LIMLA|nr:hypothetical protein llap_3608 [Limosa lapponica baueri]
MSSQDLSMLFFSDIGNLETSQLTGSWQMLTQFSRRIMAVILFLTLAVLGVVPNSLQLGGELDVAPQPHAAVRRVAELEDDSAAAGYTADPGIEWGG